MEKNSVENSWIRIVNRDPAQLNHYTHAEISSKCVDNFLSYFTHTQIDKDKSINSFADIKKH